MAFGEAIGETGGFGEAVAAAEAEGPGSGGFEADKVAGGDVEGGDAGTGTEGEADDLVVVDEGDAGAGFGRERAVFAAEAALGDADGGDTGEEADVAGDAEAAGVRVSLAIDEKEVRPAGQALQGEADSGGLPEGEEAGHIGESNGTLGDGLLHDIKAGIGQQNGSRPRHAGPGDAPTPTRRVDVSHVGGGNEPHVPRVAFADGAGSEPLLAGGRIGGREVPGVQVQETHAVQYTETRQGGPAWLYRKYYAVIMRHQ
jgi:hypothetical protein